MTPYSTKSLKKGYRSIYSLYGAVFRFEYFLQFGSNWRDNQWEKKWKTTKNFSSNFITI